MHWQQWVHERAGGVGWGEVHGHLCVGCLCVSMCVGVCGGVGCGCVVGGGTWACVGGVCVCVHVCGVWVWCGGGTWACVGGVCVSVRVGCVGVWGVGVLLGEVHGHV